MGHCVFLLSRYGVWTIFSKAILSWAVTSVEGLCNLGEKGFPCNRSPARSWDYNIFMNVKEEVPLTIDLSHGKMYTSFHEWVSHSHWFIIIEWCLVTRCARAQGVQWGFDWTRWDLSSNIDAVKVYWTYTSIMVSEINCLPRRMKIFSFGCYMRFGECNTPSSASASK